MSQDARRVASEGGPGLRRLLDWGDRVFMAIAAFALLAMGISICADALGRYVFHSPLTGNYEFTSFYAMVMLAFMALPATYASGGHIRLEVFTSRLERLPWRLSERINVVFGIVAFGILTWATGHEAVDKFVTRETTLGSIQFPMYWSYVWVPLGAGWLTIRLIFELFVPQARATIEPSR